MRLLAIALAISAATGCMPLENRGTGATVSRFDDVGKFEGRAVEMKGLISLRHEAVGLYYDEKSLRSANRKCVELPGVVLKALEGKHRRRIRLTDVVKRSACRSELICLNTCREWHLSDARIQ